MEKRKKIIIFCRCLATVILFVCVFSCISDALAVKESRDRYQEFYEQKENIDVLILGTSHVFNGISPMDMWEQNGIIAYDLAAPGCRIPSAYWILKNALQYTEPKLVVLDCAYLFDVKAHEKTGYMHVIFDAMPLSKTKLEALTDLYDRKEEIVEHLVPFLVYHSRWNELEIKDFFYKPDYGKMGFGTGCDVVDAVLPDFTVNEVKKVHNVSTEYLYKIIELCEQQGMDLLFTFLPFNTNEESKNDAAYVRMIAEQKGIAFLGPDELQQCINLRTDFVNNNSNNSHLNLSGAHKLSYYLGNYIAQNYEVADQRENPRYDDWHRYYALYEDHKLSLMKAQGQLENYLVGMADRNYTGVVYVHDTACIQNERVLNLLRNLNMDMDRGMETGLFIQPEKAIWAGNVEIRSDKDGKPALFLNHEMLYSWDASATDAGIYVVVMDNSGENVLDAATFSASARIKIS